MTIEAITPSQIHDANHVPDFVMEAWNEIIAEKFDDGRSYITQTAIVDRIMRKAPPAGRGGVRITRTTIFDRGWLNIESKFRQAGWIVKYDKPGYNETYEANFTFTPKRKGR